MCPLSLTEHEVGDVLISSGDDGKVRAWKRAYDAMNGTADWLEYSVIGTRADEEDANDE